jgi:nucleotide-binding universal stress UspA family protein
MAGMTNPPKKILVPTDFSAPSEAAIDYAVALGQKLGASVHVVHSFELPLVGFPDGVLTVPAEMASRIIEASQTALGRIRETYARRGVTLDTSLEQADPREGILSAAKKVSADLIVMGTHGRRGLARALIGSVTEAVVRSAPVPVLTVHAEPKAG